MRSVVVKLFKRRSAEGMLIVGEERTVRPEGKARARAGGDPNEVTVAEVALGVVAVLLEAPAELESDAFKIDSLQTVNAERVLFGARRRGFHPDRHVISCKAGKPDNAGEFASPRVVEIGAVIEIFIGRERLELGDVFVRLELEFA